MEDWAIVYEQLKGSRCFALDVPSDYATEYTIYTNETTLTQSAVGGLIAWDFLIGFLERTGTIFIPSTLLGIFIGGSYDSFVKSALSEYFLSLDGQSWELLVWMPLICAAGTSFESMFSFSQSFDNDFVSVSRSSTKHLSRSSYIGWVSCFVPSLSDWARWILVVSSSREDEEGDGWRLYTNKSRCILLVWNRIKRWFPESWKRANHRMINVGDILLQILRATFFSYLELFTIYYADGNWLTAAIDLGRTKGFFRIDSEFSSLFPFRRLSDIIFIELEHSYNSKGV